MNYRVFYCCNSSGDEIESENAIGMDRDTIVGTAMQLLREEGDFFGIIDEKDNTLQFLLGENEEVLMEVPKPSGGGSNGKQIMISEVESVLLSLEGEIDPSSFSGMKFESWG